jgi:A/G-specific adenine glycosylase
VCPIAAGCAWLSRGRPALDVAVRRPQVYAGTDRQVRGRLLAVLRDADGPVPREVVARAWDEPVQRARALDGLLADGLVEPLPDGRLALPTRAARSGR